MGMVYSNNDTKNNNSLDILRAILASSMHFKEKSRSDH